MLTTYSKEEIDDFNSKAICCYGDTVVSMVTALQDGCPEQACEYRLKAKRLFLIMYALDSIEMDDTGMTENNDLTADGLINIISYLLKNCNCTC